MTEDAKADEGETTVQKGCSTNEGVKETSKSSSEVGIQTAEALYDNKTVPIVLDKINRIEKLREASDKNNLDLSRRVSELEEALGKWNIDPDEDAEVEEAGQCPAPHIERQYIDRRQRVHGDGKVNGDLTLVRTQRPHRMYHNQGGGDRVIPSSLGSQLPPGLAPHQISGIPSASTRQNPGHGDGQATRVDGTGSEHLRMDYCVEFVKNPKQHFR